MTSNLSPIKQKYMDDIIFVILIIGIFFINYKFNPLLISVWKNSNK